MNDSRVAVRVPQEVKDQAMEIYQEIGIDLSTAINVFLRKSIAEGGFPFNVRIERTGETE